MMERTIERPRVGPAETTDNGRRTASLVLTAIVAAAVGLLAGFLLWDSDGGEPDAVVVGGGELTARQEEMLELIDDYELAWRNGDGEAVAALFTEQGVLDVIGTEVPIEGGALADYVDGHPAPTLEVLEPALVSGDRLVNLHRIGAEGVVGPGRYSNVFEFTSEGEVLIVSHDLMR